MTELANFVATMRPHGRIRLHEFCTLFRATLSPADQKFWSRDQIKKWLEERFPVGKDSSGVLYVANLSAPQPETPLPTWTVDDTGRLRLQPPAG